ncbi:septal ring lytic transglycosylase RlpA family protein [Thiohalobacter sp. IOR34]|uniref:septal ring lytic transglycosylase RlpA family protein n=1 Tax=Thiohalobacter sp. IOR34 TaxID=3057176 RepID=UPI0025AF615D|nr:septal ring lytic transglycosylase RlpA family protein [Thiohalobacter sp. IOR34]WJW75928.1 septal ring lytic transglycosylase RlpA family protein [Thiohalobacter sp. IOR34]
MKRGSNQRRGLLALATIIGLAGCSGGGLVSRDGGPDRYVDVSRIPDAVPRHEPRSRYGNPDSYVVRGKRYYVRHSSRGYVERGIASWYGTKFHGRRTSSGEPYDMYAMTAAHKTLPLPTYARVTNLRNGRSVVVKINDRGPFHDNRLIDLSYAAARKLGIVGKGTGLVEVRAITPGEPEARPPLRSASAGAAVHHGSAELYLQVGAFSSRSNAERLRQRLGALARPVHILRGLNRQRTVFRVRIGPLASVEEADRMAENLSHLGIESPHVVID